MHIPTETYSTCDAGVGGGEGVPTHCPPLDPPMENPLDFTD